MNGIKWSKTEKEIARKAFDLAYDRECSTIVTKLNKMIAIVQKPEDIWEIHEFLTSQRKRMDEKYDYRYSLLIFVLARLLKEGWLKEHELKGFQEDKLERIKFLVLSR